MKKLLLTTFVFANLSLVSMACDFHDGEYFSRYNWPRVSFNHTAASDTTTGETEKVTTNSAKKQPDFRYTRAQSPVMSNDDSNKELNDNLD